MPRHPTDVLARVPTSCFVDVTDACNLCCLHCEADAGRAAPDELTVDEIAAVARDLAAAGCKDVFLTGGEPLVRAGWDAIAALIVKLGMRVTIVTNGVLADRTAIGRMVDTGVYGLSVSLDGDRDVHDEIRRPGEAGLASRYDLAVRAIELAVASPLKTGVITQIHRRNLGDLGRMYEQMVAWGIDVWQVQLCMPLGRMRLRAADYVIDPADIDGLQGQLAGFIADGRCHVAVGDNVGYYGRDEPALRGAVRRTKSFWVGCLAGCRVVALCSNGDVKGCPSHPREFVVGNVRATPFPQIWADRRRFFYQDAWDDDRLAAGCRECPYRRLCRAGCTTMAHATTGSIYDNPFCVQRARPAEPEP
jgi:radical SAM protein with 4Fe4S-binding SPASM domain